MKKTSFTFAEKMEMEEVLEKTMPVLRSMSTWNAVDFELAYYLLQIYHFDEAGKLTRAWGEFSTAIDNCTDTIFDGVIGIKGLDGWKDRVEARIRELLDQRREA